MLSFFTGAAIVAVSIITASRVTWRAAMREVYRAGITRSPIIACGRAFFVLDTEEGDSMFREQVEEQRARRRAEETA